MENPLIGKVTLNKEIVGFPAAGYTFQKIRVELSEMQNDREAWITELEILGELPWTKGESRIVKIRIMSDEFRKHVEIHHPTLLVNFGPSRLGVLEFDS